MVNPGHASRGCGTCKARRVRCDEVWPVCRRCVTSRRLCLGYSSRNDSNRGDDTRGAVVRAPPSSGLSLSLATSVPSALSFIGQDAAAGPQLLEATTAVEDVVHRGLASLIISDPSIVASQTHAERRAQLARYGAATRRLRALIAFHALPGANGNEGLTQPHGPLRAVYLMALYEMVVNTSLSDQTWKIHVDGLLALLRQWVQQHRRLGGEVLMPTLALALQVDLCGDEIPKPATGAPGMLLDIALLQLRRLGPELDNSNRNARWRQLDAHKIRRDITHVQRTLRLYPVCVAANGAVGPCSVQEQREAAFFHALSGVCASAMARTGAVLSVGAGRNRSNDTADKRWDHSGQMAARESAEGVLRALDQDSAAFPEDTGQRWEKRDACGNEDNGGDPSATTGASVLDLWALASCLLAPPDMLPLKIAEQVAAALRRLGLRRHLPVALTLVSLLIRPRPRHGTSWFASCAGLAQATAAEARAGQHGQGPEVGTAKPSDVLAGLVLASPAFNGSTLAK